MKSILNVVCAVVFAFYAAGGIAADMVENGVKGDVGSSMIEILKRDGGHATSPLERLRRVPRAPFLCASLFSACSGVAMCCDGL